MFVILVRDKSISTLSKERFLFKTSFIFVKIAVDLSLVGETFIKYFPRECLFFIKVIFISLSLSSDEV